MRSTTNWARGTTAVSRLSPELSPRAKQRLQWITHVEKNRNKSLTCRYFGISRPTLDRALKRYDPQRLASLEDLPSRLRQPTWAPELLAEAVADQARAVSPLGQRQDRPSAARRSDG